MGPDGTPSTAGNPTKATQLMQAYANDKCGGQMSKCTPVTLYDFNDPSIVTNDEAAVQMWQTAFPGLRISTRFVDANTLISLVTSAETPQIFGAGWIADYPDPQDWLPPQFEPNSANNIGSVNVPAANALMAQADVDLTPTARTQLYNQAERLLVTDCAWIPISQNKNSWNMPAYVHDFAFDALGVVPLDMWQQVYLTAH